jgi:hypothetical protein
MIAVFWTREFQQHVLRLQIRVVSRGPRARVQHARGGRLSRGFRFRAAWQLRDGARQLLTWCVPNPISFCPALTRTTVFTMNGFLLAE